MVSKTVLSVMETSSDTAIGVLKCGELFRAMMLGTSSVGSKYLPKNCRSPTDNRLTRLFRSARITAAASFLSCHPVARAEFRLYFDAVAVEA